MKIQLFAADADNGEILETVTISKLEYETLKQNVATGKRLLLEEMGVTAERTKLAIELRTQLAEAQADKAEEIRISNERGQYIEKLLADIAGLEAEKAELVKQNNLLEINLRKTKLELSEWDRSYNP